MNFLPLWTARVWPTNSGAIVERRDHVLRTFFWRERFISSMRPSSVSSMYGPFFSERPIPGSYFFRRVTIHASDGRNRSRGWDARKKGPRSEEHTSELQSQSNL